MRGMKSGGRPARGKRATVEQRQKTPTSRGWGQVPRRHWHLSPRKAPQSKTRQVSWLAAHAYSLRLPKVGYLSGLRRFRSAHSCGAAMALHHLPCSQRRAVRQPGFLQSVNCLVTITECPPPCQAKRQATTNVIDKLAGIATVISGAQTPESDNFKRRRETMAVQPSQLDQEIRTNQATDLDTLL